MARPSKLSPEQWREVERRATAGESLSRLAEEFGVSLPTVSKRISQVSKPVVQAVAHKLADAQAALAALPAPQQYMAVSLAEKLRNISQSLASAAELGSATAHRLHALANSEVAKVDDAEPMASIESLRNVGVLTKLANESSHIAIGLLAANKDRMAQQDEAGEDTAAILMRARGRSGKQPV